MTEEALDYLNFSYPWIKTSANTYAPFPAHFPENRRHRNRVRALRQSRGPGPSTINAANN